MPRTAPRAADETPGAVFIALARAFSDAARCVVAVLFLGRAATKRDRSNLHGDIRPRLTCVLTVEVPRPVFPRHGEGVTAWDHYGRERGRSLIAGRRVRVTRKGHRLPQGEFSKSAVPVDAHEEEVFPLRVAERGFLAPPDIRLAG
jgi:hypothetical protein